MSTCKAYMEVSIESKAKDDYPCLASSTLPTPNVADSCPPTPAERHSQRVSWESRAWALGPPLAHAAREITEQVVTLRCSTVQIRGQ